MNRIPLVLALIGVLGATPHVQRQMPSVFVGPQMREGFADVDAGIRDSIADIVTECKQAGFAVSSSRSEATLVLVVMARGIVTSGSVGVGTPGFLVVTPNATPTLTTTLVVGSYERRMQSEGTTWTGAARRAVADLGAWWEANQAAVRARSGGGLLPVSPAAGEHRPF